MCLKKHRFETQAEALLASKDRQRKIRQGLTPYLCPFCGGYHYGHTPRRVRQAIRSRLMNET